MPGSSQPLSYSPAGGAGVPPYPPPRVSLFSVAAFMSVFTVMSVLLVIFIFVIPKFETIFNDFGTKLPWITTIVLDIGRFMRTPLGWVVGALVAGGIAATAAFVPIPRRWLWLLMITTLALIIIALALALFLPMLHLIDSISGASTPPPGGKK